MLTKQIEMGGWYRLRNTGRVVQITSLPSLANGGYFFGVDQDGGPYRFKARDVGPLYPQDQE